MRHRDPELMQRISEYIGEVYRERHVTPSTREIASAMGIEWLVGTFSVFPTWIGVSSLGVFIWNSL